MVKFDPQINNPCCHETNISVVDTKIKKSSWFLINVIQFILQILDTSINKSFREQY